MRKIGIIIHFMLQNRKLIIRKATGLQGPQYKLTGGEKKSVKKQQLQAIIIERGKK